RLGAEKQETNRLYVIESTVTSTGSVADHRLPARPSEIELLTRAIAAGLGVSAGNAVTATPDQTHSAWLTAVVNDLKQRRGSSIVIAGESQPPVVHALAHAINQALGNVGATVTYTDAIEASPVDGNASLRELAQDMDAGKVQVLIIIGGNPVYNAPADVDFAEKIRKVPLRAHLSLYFDETSELFQWHIPEAHYLESWSDARAFDGAI